MLAERVKILCEKKGLDKQSLSELLDINYFTFLRNVKQNKLTAEIILAVADKFPDEDLNLWIKEKPVNKIDNLEEPKEIYNRISSEKLDDAIAILMEIKQELSRG